MQSYGWEPATGGDLPFEQGVVKDGEMLDCHPFLPEQRYRAKLQRERITLPEIEAVLREELGGGAVESVGPVGTWLQL